MSQLRRERAETLVGSQLLVGMHLNVQLKARVWKTKWRDLRCCAVWGTDGSEATETLGDSSHD